MTTSTLIVLKTDEDSVRRVRNLHRYAIVLCCSIVILIFLGSHVKSTEAGLSVPDWPNTYGHFMFAFPWESMVGGIFWEHLHRMVASVVGLMTFVFTLWTFKVEIRKWVRRVALIASIAVLVQGLLGGLTVLTGLPAIVSSMHGTLAQLFFCCVIAVAVATSRTWIMSSNAGRDKQATRLRRLALITTGTIAMQLLIGAIMRHTESGLAIPDFPMMFGKWLPPLSHDDLAAANKELWKLGLLWQKGNQEISVGQILINVAHRLNAIAIATCVVALTVMVYRQVRFKGLRVAVTTMSALIGVQIALGILTILTQKQFTIASLHVVCGAMVLATSVIISMRATRATLVLGLEERSRIGQDHVFELDAMQDEVLV